MDEREQDVDERGTGEHAVCEAEDRSEPPPAAADRDEQGVVDQRERQPDQKVQDVAERLGTGPVARERRAKQDREVDACQVELVPARSAVVSTTVPANPPATAPQTLTAPSPWRPRARR